MAFRQTLQKRKINIDILEFIMEASFRRYETLDVRLDARFGRGRRRYTWKHTNVLWHTGRYEVTLLPSTTNESARHKQHDHAKHYHCTNKKTILSISRTPFRSDEQSSKIKWCQSNVAWNDSYQSSATQSAREQGLYTRHGKVQNSSDGTGFMWCQNHGLKTKHTQLGWWNGRKTTPKLRPTNNDHDWAPMNSPLPLLFYYFIFLPVRCWGE